MIALSQTSNESPGLDPSNVPSIYVSVFHSLINLPWPPHIPCLWLYD